jgi:hypothetical protein
MRAFRNRGWEYYGKCSSIMHLSIARGTHVFRPTSAAATEPTLFEDHDEDDISTAVDLAAGSAKGKGPIEGPSTITNSSDSIVTVASTSMDIDTPEPSQALSSKRSHSLMVSESEPSSSLAPPTASTSKSSEHPVKKRSKGSGVSGQSSSGAVALSKKITPASAVVGMQASINRLTDIFKANMDRDMPEDPANAARDRAIGLVQEHEDNLTTEQKVQLVTCFMKDVIAANTYISLTDPEVRRAWINMMLAK